MWPKGLEATAVLAHLVALCSCLETPQKSYLLLISAYCSFSVAYSYANAVHPGLKKCHLNSCRPFSGPVEGCLEVAGCPTPLLWAVVSNTSSVWHTSDGGSLLPALLAVSSVLCLCVPCEDLGTVCLLWVAGECWKKKAAGLLQEVCGNRSPHQHVGRRVRGRRNPSFHRR